MKYIKKISTGLILVFTPIMAFADKIWGEDYNLGDGSEAVLISKNFFDLVSRWIEWIAGALMGAAVIVFFYGIVKYILSAGDETKRKEGKGFMVYGVIGLFVMTSVWGLVYLISALVGIRGGGGVDLPTLTPDDSSGATTDWHWADYGGEAGPIVPMK